MDNEIKYSDNNIYQSQNDERGFEIDVFELFMYLVSKWMFLLIAGVLAAVLVFTYTSVFVEPQYKSNITLNVENKRGQMDMDDISSGDIAASESLAETYRVILNSNSVRDAVVGDLKNKGVVISEKDLRASVSVSPISKTQILDIAVTHTDPRSAYVIAKTYETIAPEMIIKLTNWGRAYVVDHARMPLAPSSPNVSRTTVLGFLVGAIICSIVLLISKFSDRRVYLAEDIESTININVIGQIPMGNPENIEEDCHYTVKKGIVFNEKK